MDEYDGDIANSSYSLSVCMCRLKMVRELVNFRSDLKLTIFLCGYIYQKGTFSLWTGKVSSSVVAILKRLDSCKARKEETLDS